MPTLGINLCQIGSLIYLQFLRYPAFHKIHNDNNKSIYKERKKKEIDKYMDKETISK